MARKSLEIPKTSRSTLYCGFCGSSQHEVAALLAGPYQHFICDTCVLDAVHCIRSKNIPDFMIDDTDAFKAGIAHGRKEAFREVIGFSSAGGNHE